MAKKTLGRIFPVPEGTYSSSKTYKELSIVTYNGNSYICKKQSSGNDPTNTTYWQLMASKGEQGIQGVPGERGEPGSSTTTATSKTYDKYVVFCVAGQSNAVGYDESVVDDKFIYKNRDNDRIKQLGFYGEDNLKLVNLGYCAQSMQDMRVNNRVGQQYCGTKGIHLPLANLMLDYIPDDYGILVLPIAYGGTGFTSGNNGTYSSSLKKPTEADPKASSGGQGTAILRWGTDTAYYQTLRDRIIHALKLNDDNLFAGIVWCQGENDKTNASGHKSSFEAMTEKLFQELNTYESGSLKARVPKKVWDKDIWYNMETVSYWYTQNQCQQIWDNYKAWNEKTYVEIPRSTESNTVATGTGDTTKTYASHYGQNAYQRVIAPRVLQKMIDMNTFAKRVNVVEPECKTSESSGGSSSYPVATEGTRTLVQSDITKTSTINFTVDGSGNCTASETLSGKFKTGTNQPCVSFGDIFKMEWEAKRGQYWMVIEGDITDGFLVLGIGGNMTCQLAKIQGGRLEILDHANGYGSRHYTIRTGDKIRVYRNSDKTISIYRTNNADGIFQKWFDYENKNVFEKKSFGFALGIGGNEFNGDFSGSQELVFNGMKIQKQELFPNNKLLDLQLDEMVRALKA